MCGFLWNVPFLFVDHPLGLVELWSLFDSYENRVALFLMPCFFELPCSRECRDGTERLTRVSLGGCRQGNERVVESPVALGKERLRSSLCENDARTLKFMLEKHCLSISLQIASSRLGTRKDEVSVGSGFVFIWFRFVFEYFMTCKQHSFEKRNGEYSETFLSCAKVFFPLFIFYLNVFWLGILMTEDESFV